MHMTQRSIDQSVFVEISCFVISVAEICDFVTSGSCVPDAYKSPKMQNNNSWHTSHRTQRSIDQS